ncbi:MAG: hypothetical protein HKL80_03045, partial [Acidimicrobiales bacterium]|nr:hypothetical protein [Acidimicrobiales bacterium]
MKLFSQSDGIAPAGENSACRSYKSLICLISSSMDTRGMLSGLTCTFNTTTSISTPNFCSSSYRKYLSKLVIGVTQSSISQGTVSFMQDVGNLAQAKKEDYLDLSQTPSGIPLGPEIYHYDGVPKITYDYVSRGIQVNLSSVMWPSQWAMTSAFESHSNLPSKRFGSIKKVRDYTYDSLGDVVRKVSATTTYTYGCNTSTVMSNYTPGIKRENVFTLGATPQETNACGTSSMQLSWTSISSNANSSADATGDPVNRSDPSGMGAGDANTILPISSVPCGKFGCPSVDVSTLSGREAYAFLTMVYDVQDNWTAIMAAAVVGNLVYESGGQLDPSVWACINGTCGGGIAQWTYQSARWNGMVANGGWPNS